jgi:LPXTG-site transpeptidase (sortase) family protein
VRKRILLIVERSLLVVGVTLGAWCLVQIVEAQRVQQMPVPPPSAIRPAGENPARGVVGKSGKTDPRPKVNTGAWLARLEASSVNMSATVLEGSDDRTLARGAGHIEDTAFPGEPGNVGVAGHRDTIFRPVRHLRLGDPLVMTTADTIYRYKITRMAIVEPKDVFVLDPINKPSLTLVTCFPFDFIGHAPKRYIVGADLVAEEPRSTR